MVDVLEVYIVFYSGGHCFSGTLVQWFFIFGILIIYCEWMTHVVLWLSSFSLTAAPAKFCVYFAGFIFIVNDLVLFVVEEHRNIIHVSNSDSSKA